MLRRNSTRGNHKRPLGRSKSTGSIAGRPVGYLTGIDPVVARRDAQIAAHLSFYRSHDTSMACASHGELLRRRNSVDDRLMRPPREGVQRTQSVRFAGPNAVPKRQLAARAKPVVLAEGKRVLRQPLEPGARAFDAAALTDYERSFAISYLTHDSTLAHQQGGPLFDNPLSSNPQCSKSLRKCKSMYAQPCTSTPDYVNGHVRCGSSQGLISTPLTMQSQRKREEMLRISLRHSLRTPRSMNDLGHQQRRMTGSSAEIRQEGFLNSVHDGHAKGSFRRLKSKSSQFFRARQRQHDVSTGTSTSWRMSSDESAAFPLAFSDNAMPPAKRDGIRSTVRKVSRNMRNKLSRLFGRSKDSDTSGTDGVPHHLADTDGESIRALSDTPPVEEASVLRVTSRVPSLHAVPSYQQLRSRQGSLESIRYDDHLGSDDRSRITSWTNSTAYTIHEGSEERECQRLSVIKENGTHTPSSSHIMPCQKLPSPVSIPSANRLKIDSQRVYSALMKKLASDRRALETADSCPVPPRKSSLDQGTSPIWSSRSARCDGTSDDDVFAGSEDASSVRVSSRSPEARKDDENGQKSSFRAYPAPVAGDGKGLSPAQVALPRSVSKHGDGQAEGGRQPFPLSPNDCYFRTTSPYRRALQRNMQEHQDTEHTRALDTRYWSALSALSLPTRHPSTAGSEKDLRLTYAESFYSFTSEDLTRNYTGGLGSPPALKDRSVEAAMDAPATMQHVAHNRGDSTASSVEWKTWLSAHVSEQDSEQAASPSRDTAGNSQPCAGHVREDAETESPADIHKLEEPCTTPYNVWAEEDGRLVSHVGVVGARIPEGGDQRASATDRSSADKNSYQTMEPPTATPASAVTPPVPCRNALRTMPSSSYLNKGAACRSTKKGSPLLPKMRSLNVMPSPRMQRQDEPYLMSNDQENEHCGIPSSFGSSPRFADAACRDAVNTEAGSPVKLGTRSSISAPQTPDEASALPQESEREQGTAARSQWDAQIKGSRRMVDLFLSSRRRAIDGAVSRNVSENSSAAVFL